MLSAAAVGIGLAQQPPASPAPKPIVPVVASTITADPGPYIGQTVSLMATVERRLSPTAFSVDQDRTKSTGAEVLILARTLTGGVDLNAYVTVIGEVVRFDPDTIAGAAKDYPLDLPPDAIAAYRGKPAILATSVITAAMVDVARRLPPPLTAEEEAFDKIMKRVGPAFTALRQALAGSNADAAKQQAAVLGPAFGDVEAFWKTRGKADASGWARDARQHVDAIARAAAAGRWDEAATPATALGQACQSCHAAYRERLEDGAYRIRSGDR
jgi:cytochrome c556